MSAVLIDASDFDRLAADLDAAARTDLLTRLDAVVSKGALDVKKGMQEDLTASESFYRLAPAVSYETQKRADSVEAEIGVEPDKVVPPGARPKHPGTAGNLYGIAVFGGVRGGGGTVPDPDYLLAQDAPRMEEAVGAVLDDLIAGLAL